MEKDEASGHYIHEVTGRPYLAVGSGGGHGLIHLGHGLVHLVYKFDRWLQPYLCKVGKHNVWDVTEVDASVINGFCDTCKVLTKPRKAMPADPAKVVEWEKFKDFDFCCCDGECTNC